MFYFVLEVNTVRMNKFDPDSKYMDILAPENRRPDHCGGTFVVFPPGRSHCSIQRKRRSPPFPRRPATSTISRFSPVCETERLDFRALPLLAIGFGSLRGLKTFIQQRHLSSIGPVVAVVERPGRRWRSDSCICGRFGRIDE